eukprot:158254-Prymnesium_polylepis.1
MESCSGKVHQVDVPASGCTSRAARGRTHARACGHGGSSAVLASPFFKRCYADLISEFDTGGSGCRVT